MTAATSQPQETPEPGPQETAAPATGPGEQAVTTPVDAPVDAPGEEPVEDDSTRLTRELAERTADLQRLQAEYVNYKRRVDRDRAVARDQATAGVLSALLPVLDDLDRARQHDELTGGFKAVAESLERIVVGLGLERFGVAGEEFDPRVHEALMHGYSADVSVTTAQTILQPGYRLGERIVRPARVAVAEPSGEVAESEPVTEPASEPVSEPVSEQVSEPAAGTDATGGGEERA